MSLEVEKFFAYCKKEQYVSFFTDNQTRTERFVSFNGYAVTTGCYYTDQAYNVTFLEKSYPVSHIKWARYFWLQKGVSLLRPTFENRCVCTGLAISYFNRKLTGDEKFDVHFEIPDESESFVLAYGAVINSNLILLD
jgi:hypothetical protein